MPSIQIRSTLRMGSWEAIQKGLPENAQQALLDTGNDIVDDLKAHWSASSPSSPGEPPAVVSGALDASVASKPGMSAAGGGVFQATVTATAPHAKFLEYGTSHMAARPFLRPAVMRAKGTIRSRLKIVFDKK